MSRYELNSKVFKDGRIVLYQRPGSKKSIWNARIKVPGSTGYFRGSTGTGDEYEARKWADEKFDDLRAQVKAGISLKSPSVAQVLPQFEAAYEISAPSPRRFGDVTRFLKTYATDYFGKIKLSEISSQSIEQYLDWRRKNPRGKKKGVPAHTTILYEMSSLKVFLDWCHAHGHMQRQVPFKRMSRKGNRRPHFDAKDWKVLTRNLREWVKKGDTADAGWKRRERIMLTSYILILANTGIRIGEARTLRWRDIDKDKDGNVILLVKGKTGSREVVARDKAVKDYFDRIEKLRCEETGLEKLNRDEPIFAHRDGTQIGSFKKGFQNFIRSIGVEKDSQGQRRTIYSLRHTYATFRLQENVQHYALARNMGTSVKMLEDFYGHNSNRAMADELTKTRKRTITPPVEGNVPP